MSKTLKNILVTIVLGVFAMLLFSFYAYAGCGGGCMHEDHEVSGASSYDFAYPPPKEDASNINIGANGEPKGGGPGQWSYDTLKITDLAPGEYAVTTTAWYGGGRFSTQDDEIMHITSSTPGQFEIVPDQGGINAWGFINPRPDPTEVEGIVTTYIDVCEVSGGWIKIEPYSNVFPALRSLDLVQLNVVRLGPGTSCAPAVPPGAPNITAVTPFYAPPADYIRVDYDAPTSGGTVDGYKIYRCDGSACVIDTSTEAPYDVDPSGPPDYPDSFSLTNGNWYGYCVSAYNLVAGDGPCSNTEYVRFLPPTPVPLPPTITTVTPQYITASMQVDYTGSAGADGYRVYRCSDTVIGCTINIAVDPVYGTDPSGPPSYDDTGSLIDGIWYGYCITAYNLISGSSACSVTEYAQYLPPAVVNPPPGSPTITSVTPQYLTGRIQIDYTPPGGGADSYRIYRCSDTVIGCIIDTAIDTVHGLDTDGPPSYDDSVGLVNGTWYGYCVSAYTTLGGEGICSAPWHVQYVPPVASPAKPTLTAGACTLATIPLSWTFASGATDYHIYRCGDVGTTPLCTPSTGIGDEIGTRSTLSYFDGGLPINISFGSTYSYIVKGHNHVSGLYSLNSDKVSSTCLPSGPNPVTITVDRSVVASSGDTVTATWTSSNAVSCIVTQDSTTLESGACPSNACDDSRSITVPGPTTLTITCTNGGGTTSASVSVSLVPNYTEI